MPLKLELKPHERLIIGGSVVRNGNCRTQLLIENDVPVLREADILGPGCVNTACERIYLALQLLYVDPGRADAHRQSLAVLMEEAATAAPSLGPTLGDIQELVQAGNLYRAIKKARNLFAKERELIDHVR